ncbi:MAG: transcriptional regulator [Hyphomicrobiales bacterium]|nr:transcriptional regulator [Hyphomicrobiales bacterium]
MGKAGKAASAHGSSGRKSTDGGNATRAHIQQTATELFGRLGYRAVTVRDITDAAAVNVSAINYHFGGKEGLYHAIVESLVRDISDLIGPSLDALSAAVGAARDDAHLRSAAEKFVSDWAIHVLGDTGVQRRLPIIALELALPTGVFPRIYNGFYARLYEALGALVAKARGIERSSLEHAVRVHALASLLLGFVASERVLWRSLSWRSYSRPRVAGMIPHLARAFVDALGLPPAARKRAVEPKPRVAVNNQTDV